MLINCSPDDEIIFNLIRKLQKVPDHWGIKELTYEVDMERPTEYRITFIDTRECKTNDHDNR